MGGVLIEHRGEGSDSRHYEVAGSQISTSAPSRWAGTVCSGDLPGKGRSYEGLDPRRILWAHPCSGKIRSSTWLQIFYLREALDSSAHFACPRDASRMIRLPQRVHEKVVTM